MGGNQCLLIILLAAALAPWASSANEMDDLVRKEDRPMGKDFPEGLKWINTDKPVTLAALKGKVVLLDFWTFG